MRTPHFPTQNIKTVCAQESIFNEMNAFCCSIKVIFKLIWHFKKNPQMLQVGATASTGARAQVALPLWPLLHPPNCQPSEEANDALVLQ